MWWPSLILASLLGPLVTSALPQGGRSQVLKEIFLFLFFYLYISIFYLVLGGIVGLELFEKILGLFGKMGPPISFDR